MKISSFINPLEQKFQPLCAEELPQDSDFIHLRCAQASEFLKAFWMNPNVQRILNLKILNIHFYLGVRELAPTGSWKLLLNIKEFHELSKHW